MSSDVAIRVENLSKVYRIGAREARYKTLRESVMDVVGAPLKRLRRRAPTEEETLWALKDVSFEIKKGEVVGIIGRNGAGKSTLLKILSRITEPTSGRAEIHGRVGSLLEVGTGFHPELTGRENIYLNGAILGMRRAEIDSKLDEIVAFAEVERFLDTAVKHYSSGMYLRLAFAVAAHLDTEILLVDEVLAVGDLRFQRKCLGKLEEVSRQGRTVLFVSHNLHAVSQLCDQAVRLEGGHVADYGLTDLVLHAYTSAESQDRRVYSWTPAERPGDENVQLLSIAVEPGVGQALSTASGLTVTLQVVVKRPVPALCVGFDLHTQDRIHVFRSFHNDGDERSWPQLGAGSHNVVCHVPPDLLSRGLFSISPAIGIHSHKWIVRDQPVLHFQLDLTHGSSPLWCATTRATRPGVVAPILRWSVNAAAEPNEAPAEA